MENIRIDGKGTIPSGIFGEINVDGCGQCDGELRADRIVIDGKFKCLGKLNAGLLECDGMAECDADVHAKKMIVDGFFAVGNGTKIEAEAIHCDGSIRVNGQISADLLEADGMIQAAEIVGDKIVIKSNLGHLAKLLMRSHSSVDLIEATTIELTGVTAQTVNGCDIVIGPRCKIDHLDCSGTLSIDQSSVVSNLTGNFTRTDA